MRSVADARSAKQFSSGPMSRVIVRMDHVWDTGQSHKPGCNQMNDAQAKEPIDPKLGSRARNIRFAPILEQGKMALFCDGMRRTAVAFEMKTRATANLRGWEQPTNKLYLLWTHISSLIMINKWKQSCCPATGHLERYHLTKQDVTELESRRQV